MKKTLANILGLTTISLSLGFSSISFESKYETPNQEVQYNKCGVQLYKALFPQDSRPYQIPEKELHDLQKKLKEPERKSQNITGFIVSR